MSKASTTVEFLNSAPYITTIARGTEYTLMRSYKTLAEVTQGCKAFGDFAALVKLVYGGLDVAEAINA